MDEQEQEYYQPQEDDRSLMERNTEEYVAELLRRVPDPFGEMK